MSEKDEGLLKSSVSRRQFLKVAGVAGATIGVAGGLGGLVAACGGTEETTTTTAAPATTTTAAGATTTTAAGATTTVSAAAEMGREVKIGFVTPLTGRIWPPSACRTSTASTGPRSYRRRRRLRRRQEAPGQDHRPGQPVRLQPGRPGDRRPHQQRQGRHHHRGLHSGHRDPGRRPGRSQWHSLHHQRLPVAAVRRQPRAGRPDARSSSGPTTRSGVWRTSRPTSSICGARSTNNKVVGPCSRTTPTATPGCPAGSQFGSRPVSLPSCPASIQIGTEDFTSQLAEFKKDGCEIGMGVFIPPDFTNFWKQATQQGWKPKLATYAKALLFPQSVEALGDIANGLTTEVWWTPSHPFTSSLLGETCQQFADEFTKRQRQCPVDSASAALHRLRDGGGHPEAGHQRGRQRGHHPGRQDHEARHHRWSDRLHGPGRGRHPALPGRSVPHRRERLQDPAGRRSVADGHDVSVRAHHRQHRGCEGPLASRFRTRCKEYVVDVARSRVRDAESEGCRAVYRAAARFSSRSADSEAFRASFS